ncbi:MAG: spore coat protein [Clostridium baratii]|uniref:spore coat protein n=1 Tax=Clostridium baratii TaxID=1561 RepID=UPI0006C34003|nr:spore coat protein [Clostridium baratii]MBS6006468.1 spore coat protein [Clostridium baratii]MDU1053862.1 spore coat protein [Clostridium baratii]MDU4910765.1 spore coat protein [Clostridium baratii]CUO92283.1 spore coat protein [Clostridium baratii]
MSNLISNLIQGKTEMSNEIIAMSMLAAAKEGAEMYLNATLTSSNPELRLIYSNGLGQMVAGHTAVTELTICKEWVNPNKPLLKQLLDTYNKAK